MTKRGRNRPVGGRGKQGSGSKVMRVPDELVGEVEALIDAFYLPMEGEWWEVLGVAPTASYEEVKQVYRRLARLYHPDTSKWKNAHDRTVALNEAYEAYRKVKKSLYE